MLTRSLALSCVLAMGLASALAQAAKPLHIKNAKFEAGRGRIIESGPAAKVLTEPEQERTRTFLRRFTAGR